MERREAVKLGCNGKGYFNILFYGYRCQYYLREGEGEGGGKGGVGKKANKLQHVQIPESFHQGEQRHEWQVWLVASWGDTEVTEGFAGTNISLPTPNGMAAPLA